MVMTLIGETLSVAAAVSIIFIPNLSLEVKEEGWRRAKSGVGRSRFWAGSQRHEAQGLDCARTDLAVVLSQQRAFIYL